MAVEIRYAREAELDEMIEHGCLAITDRGYRKLQEWGLLPDGVPIQMQLPDGMTEDEVPF